MAPADASNSRALPVAGPVHSSGVGIDGPVSQAATPVAARERPSEVVNEAFGQAEVQRRVVEPSAALSCLDAVAFDGFIANESDRWDEGHLGDTEAEVMNPPSVGSKAHRGNRDNGHRIRPIGHGSHTHCAEETATS